MADATMGKVMSDRRRGRKTAIRTASNGNKGGKRAKPFGAESGDGTAHEVPRRGVKYREYSMGLEPRTGYL